MIWIAEIHHKHHIDPVMVWDTESQSFKQPHRVGKAFGLRSACHQQGSRQKPAVPKRTTRSHRWDTERQSWPKAIRKGPSQLSAPSAPTHTAACRGNGWPPEPGTRQTLKVFPNCLLTKSQLEKKVRGWLTSTACTTTLLWQTWLSSKALELQVTVQTTGSEERRMPR